MNILILFEQILRFEIEIYIIDFKIMIFFADVMLFFFLFTLELIFHNASRTIYSLLYLFFISIN